MAWVGRQFLDEVHAEIFGFRLGGLFKVGQRVSYRGC